MAEFTLKELSDLLHASELSLSRLSEEERETLDRIDKEKEETEKSLGRRLTDDEAIAIEKGTPGGWEVVVKLGDMITPAIKEIRGEKSQ